MIRLVLNDQHLEEVLLASLDECRHRLFIATADVKDLHIPPRREGARRARSIMTVLNQLGQRGVEIHLLHSGVPSGPLLKRLKAVLPAGLTMRRCMRIHAKAFIVDGRRMYLGSANFTGAGLGAKSARRRNFEAGIWTDQTDMIDPVLDMLEEIWNGSLCRSCGRKIHCPQPLEEPDL
ncbi:MAG: phospholipase D family protein [Phycisphaerae bacterium]